MKIRYRLSDGEITEVESHPTHQVGEKDNEKVEEYKGTLQPVAGMKRIGENQVETIQRITSTRSIFATPVFKALIEAIEATIPLPQGTLKTAIEIKLSKL